MSKERVSAAYVPSGHINLNGHEAAEVGDMRIQVDRDRSSILLHELCCFVAPYLFLGVEPGLVVHDVHLAPQRILLLLVLEDEDIAAVQVSKCVDVMFREKDVVVHDLLSL
jgi:hypothetical protein